MILIVNVVLNLSLIMKRVCLDKKVVVNDMVSLTLTKELIHVQRPYTVNTV